MNMPMFSARFNPEYHKLFSTFAFKFNLRRYVVDRSIVSCPIDTRRALYSNIVLSGGSTMFKVGRCRLTPGRCRLTPGRCRLNPGRCRLILGWYRLTQGR